jgi:UDP-GlcNAc3NAcA epimerase
MRIATVVGARPQFVKAAVVSRALEALADVCEILIHTGQHYDFRMSDIFFRDLGLRKAKHHLGIGSSMHGAQTGRMLEAVERVLVAENPDCVLVYGDTNSTLAGTLAAATLHIPVAHVEAGLRSFNRRMPEEINRVLTDHAADLLFAPTTLAVENLRREGITDERVHLVGDVMYDAALYYGACAEATSHVLRELGVRPGEYVLATVHRAENTDDPARLEIIRAALSHLGGQVRVVLPLHPRTRAVLGEQHVKKFSKQVLLIDPVGYLDMLLLEKNARFIVTDSGGVQKEAFFYRVPCVTLRDETEWVELVELGWNRLAPPNSVDALLAVLRLALDASPGFNAQPYGNGKSAPQIAGVLRERFGAIHPSSALMAARNKRHRLSSVLDETT